MCRVLTVKPLLKNVNMFERMEIAEYIYEGVLEPSLKKQLGNITILLVSAGKLLDNMPHQLLSPRLVIELARKEKKCR